MKTNIFGDSKLFPYIYSSNIFDLKNCNHIETNFGYRFGFQGQEKDDEITGITGSHLNYKFRMYDSRIGRFFAVDPLTAKYPWNSPYAFSENRVIDGVELEGLEVELTSTKDPMHMLGAKIQVTNSIFVVGHIMPTGIQDFTGDEKDVIERPDQFKNVMNSQSPDVFAKGKADAVFLIVCMADKYAQQYSDDNPDQYYFASERRVYGYVDPEKDMAINNTVFRTYPNEEAENNKDKSQPGTWNVYKDGVKVGTYTGDIVPSREGEDYTLPIDPSGLKPIEKSGEGE